MVFNSYEYVLFLPVVLGLYWLLRHRRQNQLLLVASYLHSTGRDRFTRRLAALLDERSS